MSVFNISEVIETKIPNFSQRYPRWITQTLLGFLESVLHVKEINHFLDERKHLQGRAFIEAVFKNLHFTYSRRGQNFEKIPVTGKLICIANHPLGGLDGLALFHALGEMRPELKMVANDILLKIPNLADFFLAFDVFTTRTQKARIHRIGEILNAGTAVIFFPAAEVSRLSWAGIRDGVWHKGPVYFANKFQVPILPIHIEGKNSFLFYGASLIYKNFSTFLLAHEIFNKRAKNVEISVGKVITPEIFDSKPDLHQLSQQLKAHIYRLRQDPDAVFSGETAK